MEILGPHLNEIFQGKVTIDDGLNQAQSELEELMGK
jgi:ABC-type glycerol-3-phosphate transport system substrate-binding protein